MWVLGIWTEVVTLVHQALYWLRHLFRPSKIWKSCDFCPITASHAMLSDRSFVYSSHCDSLPGAPSCFFLLFSPWFITVLIQETRWTELKFTWYLNATLKIYWFINVNNFHSFLLLCVSFIDLQIQLNIKNCLSISWDRRIAWAQEFKASLSNILISFFLLKNSVFVEHVVFKKRVYIQVPTEARREY